jgi:phage terminase large subunit
VTIGGETVYALQPKQLQAYRLTPLYAGSRGKEHIGYGGSGGSGKSFAARAVALAAAVLWPGSTSIIFRKTEGEVLENHYQPFRTELPSFVMHEGSKVKLYDWNGQDRAFTFPHLGNSRILLGHLRHPDDVFKYQGNQYDVMVFEEATHYPWKSVSWLINNRLRATVPGSIPFCFYPSNPGNIGHAWFKRLFVTRDYREGEDSNSYAFVQAYLRDNQELLRRDPGYEKRLNRLEEPWRSWIKDGDWEAGAGVALPMIRRARHLVAPFEVPSHWHRFGAFDWGYAHPFSFGEYAVTEDGDLFKLQTITGRHRLPDEIARRIRETCKVDRLRYVCAGKDAFHVHKARGENTPTIAEQMSAEGVPLIPANDARVEGLNNLRGYLAWEHAGPNGEVDDPGLRFFDNEGNRKCLAQLEEIVPDPDDPEDALKVDADEFGAGGDDMYDETRYACASRPSRAPSMEHQRPFGTFDPAILQLEAERTHRRDDRRGDSERRQYPTHPEFGDAF